MPSNEHNGNIPDRIDDQLGKFRRERGSYLDHEVTDAIDEVLRRGGTWTAPQVLKALEKWDPLLPRPLPVAKTIRAYIRKRTPPSSGYWTLEESDGEDAALVLPVLAVIIRRENGRVLQLTNDEADWVVRLRRAVPDIPLWASYTVARMYLSYKAAGEDVASIDRIVAGTPWRNPDTYRAAAFTQVSPRRLDELADRTYEEAHHDA